MSDYEEAVRNRAIAEAKARGEVGGAEALQSDAASGQAITPEVVEPDGGGFLPVAVYNQAMQTIDANFKSLTKHASDMEIEFQKLVARVDALTERLGNLEGKTASEGAANGGSNPA